MDLGLINPPLFTYVLAIAFGPWLALSPYVATPEWASAAVTFARLWSVAFDMLTVAVLYPLGCRLYNRKVGLLAMLFAVGLFLPAREAHFAVNNTAVTFFSMLAIYFSVRVLHHPHRAVYLAAGLAIGLAAGAKLTGAATVLALLAAHVLTVPTDTSLAPAPRRLAASRHLDLLMGLVVALTTFLLISGHILWQLPQFVDTIVEHLQFGAEGYKGLQMAPGSGWSYYVGVLGWGMGWLLLIAALFSLGLTLWQPPVRAAAAVLIVYPIFLFLYLGAQKILFARFILPAVPPLIVFAAFGMLLLLGRLPQKTWATAAWGGLVCLTIIQPLTSLIWFDYLLTQPDTREVATEWLAENFPADTVIAREGYSVLPAMVLLNHHWPFKSIYLDERGPTGNDIDHYLSRKTNLVALSNFTYDRARADDGEEAARRQQPSYLERKANLIKTFNPYRAGGSSGSVGWFYLDELYGPAAETLQRLSPGPLIKIYEVPYDSQPFQTGIPNITTPVQANFGDKLLLLGYDLPTRRADSGGTIPITLYWQALNRMDETYIMFNRLLDQEQRSWGGYDRWPQETANTTLWHAGEVVTDSFEVPVANDAPAGVYTLDLGLYNQTDKTAQPLPLLRGGQPLAQNSVRIGPLKIGRPQLARSQATPQNPLAVQLGNPPAILLRGYDLTDTAGQPFQDRVQPAEALKLTLYWQSLNQTATDWSVFAHVRDHSGATMAQKDGPAGSGAYPSSLWDPGETITDSLIIPLPPDLPPGQYTIVTGLYNLIDGSRIPVPDEVDDEIELSQIIVNEDEQ